jgi:hypothetical protein
MCPGFPVILAAVIISLFLSFTDWGPDEGTISDLNRAPSSCVTLFLCGDVMTGRGIDQILPNPVDPRLYESYVEDARVYFPWTGVRKGTGVISEEKGYFLLEWD